ncbi:Tetratricopeptide repeat-containing protein [Verrucomicrobium sp. GAS474]|uniref:tetratricopeptide repeat protein n=1 Tax=Verrucomicrobium sp. GAS474 TaxID=1882831 RepID=UPI00087A8062|nr:tetratricopeptide repeat protein [Verrucomicrobium sp. GAS474]SDT96415.1 Tetratricopeptide repeat-containing protein [Verrucomicrobium sp. GAS474]
MKTKDEWLDEGNGALAVGDLAAAEAAYAAAIGIAPDDHEAWHALTMARYKQGNYAGAIEAGLRASALDPNDQMTWTSLSLAYVKENRIEEAEAAAAKAKVISWGGKIKLD